MPAGNNVIYLDLLKQYHVTLTAASSLAAPHYALAIQSLTRCPVPMTSIEELDALEGFSAGIRRRLNEMIEASGGLEKVTQKMEEAQIRNKGRRSLLQTLEAMEAQEDQIAREVEATASGLTTHRKASGKGRQAFDSDGSKDRRPSASKKKSQSTSDEQHPEKKAGLSRHTSTYMPAPRSGAWGILIGIYLLCDDEDRAEPPSTGEAKYHPKEAIIAKGQKYCRASYTYSVSRKAGSSSASTGGAKYLTAWSAMKTLLNRGMVWQKGRPATFALSEEGSRVARDIAVREGKILDEGIDGSAGSQKTDVSRDEVIPPVTSTSSQRPTLLDQLDGLDASSLLSTEAGNVQDKSGSSSSKNSGNGKHVHPASRTKAKERRHAPVQITSEDENESIFASEKGSAVITGITLPPVRPPLASVDLRVISSNVIPIRLPPKTKTTPISALYLPAKERPAVNCRLKLPARNLPYQQQQDQAPLGLVATETIIIDD